jgi:TP901 family phage tail tape measure protein
MSNEATVKLKLLLQNNISTPLKKAKEAVGKNVDEMKEKLASLKESHTKAFAAMKAEIPAFSRALELLKNPYIAITAAILAVGTAFVGVTKMALNWEEGMAKINVTAQLTQDELGKLSDQLLGIGRRNVAPLQEIPDAFNQIISAGLDVNTSLKVLEPTLQAAKAGFTDVKTVADAAVGVMNSSGRDINTVYDVLFATMNKGKAEFQDIAQYLPKIVPAARGAGISLEEMAGAWAYFTAQGQTAEQATTGMQNLTKALSTADIALGRLDEKTGKREGGLPSLGVAVYDASGKMRELKAITGDLANAMDGLTDKQKMLRMEQAGITDQQARGAVLSLIQDYNTFAETVDFVKNSQGELNEAYKNSLTSTDMWNVALNNVKFVMIKLGELFLPIVKTTGELAMKFTDWLVPALQTVKGVISEWYPVILGVAGAFAVLNAKIMLTATAIGIAKVATIAWTAVQWLLNIAMSANPIGIIIVAIGALIGVIVVLVSRIQGWGTLWNAIKVTLVVSFKQFVADWKYGITQLWLNVQIFWAKIKGFGEFVGQLFSNIAKAIKLALSGEFSAAKEMLTKKITTKADAEVTVLEKKKAENETQYKTESAARKKEIVDAWKSVNLTKKAADKAKGNKSTDNTANATANTTPNTDPDNNNNNGGGNGGSGGLKDTTDKVAGTAKQIRNITVNIDAFNKGGINTQNTNLQNMSADAIEDWFNQALLRVVRNLEMSYNG